MICFQFRGRVTFHGTPDQTKICCYISQVVDAGLLRPLFRLFVILNPSPIVSLLTPFALLGVTCPRSVTGGCGLWRSFLRFLLLTFTIAKLAWCERSNIELENLALLLYYSVTLGCRCKFLNVSGRRVCLDRPGLSVREAGPMLDAQPGVHSAAVTAAYVSSLVVFVSGIEQCRIQNQILSPAEVEDFASLFSSQFWYWNRPVVALTRRVLW